jgi:hypothetical protein
MKNEGNIAAIETIAMPWLAVYERGNHIVFHWLILTSANQHNLKVLDFCLKDRITLRLSGTRGRRYCYDYREQKI